MTLLGQNVNTYGVEFGDRQAFGKLLRACGEIEGLERVRFTSPHPSSFTDDVIAAMAETPNVMPSLHMPLQSGSDAVLRAMRRSYRSARFLGILERVRAAMPHAAITTDIIVGFPGETEEDFQATLDVVRASRFSAAFTFQYSIRPGTPAGEMANQVPKAVVQERYERLIALVGELAWEENKALVGSTVEVMFADGEGRKDGSTHRVSGRARDNRLVHVTIPEGMTPPRPARSRRRRDHLRGAASPQRGRRRHPTCAAPRRGCAGSVSTPMPPRGLGRPGDAVAASRADAPGQRRVRGFLRGPGTTRADPRQGIGPRRDTSRLDDRQPRRRRWGQACWPSPWGWPTWFLRKSWA